MPRDNIENIKKPVAALYPVVSDLRCVEVQIPDHDGYLWILAGFVSILGQTWSWTGDLDERIDRANLWIKAYEQTDWMQCMNCEQLIECITPLLEAQTSQIVQAINFAKYGSENQPGLPLSDEARARDQAAGSNPTCDLDITWAQSLQIVQYGNQLITDALELCESATNDTELAQVISELPGIDEVGVDAIFGYIDLLLEGIQENYAAQYTEEYEEQTACAIFCLAREDCEISLDDIYSVFYDRVTARFGTPPAALATISDLFFYLIDQDIDGTIIADVLMLVIFGGGVLANIFLGDVGTKTLGTLLKLAVNDANNDWELLCDCPEFWDFEWDFTTLPDSDDWAVAVGNFVAGVGIVSAASGGPNCAADINLGTITWGTSTITKIEIDGTSAVADGPAFRGAYYPVEGIFDDAGGAETGDYTLTIEPPSVSQPAEIEVQLSNTNSAPATSNIIRKVRFLVKGQCPPGDPMPFFAVIQQDQYPATDETQCIQVILPAGDEYKALLAGLLSLAATPDNYAAPDTPQAEGVAASWSDAIAEIDWSGC